MSDKQKRKMLAQSYIWHDGKCFLVSTINRESSAMFAAGSLYAETLVWECDAITHQRKGSFIAQDEDSEDDISTHLKMCEKLNSFGAAAFEVQS